MCGKSNRPQLVSITPGAARCVGRRQVVPSVVQEGMRPEATLSDRSGEVRSLGVPYAPTGAAGPHNTSAGATGMHAACTTCGAR